LSTKYRTISQLECPPEVGRGDRDESDRIEDGASLNGSVSSGATNRSEQLGSGEIARHQHRAFDADPGSQGVVSASATTSFTSAEVSM
jgi:hypothetical protein